MFEIQEIPDSVERHISNNSINGQIIAAGETVEMLNLGINLPLANSFFARIKGFSIDIYYESIYGEKWKYDMSGTIKLENFEGLPKEEQFLN